MTSHIRNILVTGGAVRIGAAIAAALAENGMRPVIHYRKSRDAALALAYQIREKYGIQALTIGSGLRTETQCRALIRRAAAAAGGLDGLVNNAAVFHKHSLADAGAKDWNEELLINFLAPVYLTRAFAAAVSGGVVINLLDRRIAGDESGCAPYLISKKALADFTRIAALELAPRFRVNAVAPGAVLPPAGQGAARVRDLAGKAPLQIRIDPNDIAAAIVYLLNSGAVTGQVIFVDGGRHLLGGDGDIAGGRRRFRKRDLAKPAS